MTNLLTLLYSEQLCPPRLLFSDIKILPISEADKHIPSHANCRLLSPRQSTLLYPPQVATLRDSTPSSINISLCYSTPLHYSLSTVSLMVMEYKQFLKDKRSVYNCLHFLRNIFRQSTVSKRMTYKICRSRSLSWNSPKSQF